jgi:hypothetical protein
MRLDGGTCRRNRWVRRFRPSTVAELSAAQVNPVLDMMAKLNAAQMIRLTDTTAAMAGWAGRSLAHTLVETARPPGNGCARSRGQHCARAL